MLLILKGKCGNHSGKDQRRRLARIGYLSENLNEIINGLKDKISTIVTKPSSQQQLKQILFKDGYLSIGSLIRKKKE